VYTKHYRKKSIMRNRFRQAGNLFLGSLKCLQIRALHSAGYSPLFAVVIRGVAGQKANGELAT
jgi:hypothetical protein